MEPGKQTGRAKRVKRIMIRLYAARRVPRRGEIPVEQICCLPLSVSYKTRGVGDKYCFFNRQMLSVDYIILCFDLITVLTLVVRAVELNQIVKGG